MSVDRCLALTKSGKRCHNHAKANGYCHVASHQTLAEKDVEELVIALTMDERADLSIDMDDESESLSEEDASSSSQEDDNESRSVSEEEEEQGIESLSVESEDTDDSITEEEEEEEVENNDSFIVEDDESISVEAEEDEEKANLSVEEEDEEQDSESVSSEAEEEEEDEEEGDESVSAEAVSQESDEDTSSSEEQESDKECSDTDDTSDDIEDEQPRSVHAGLLIIDRYPDRPWLPGTSQLIQASRPQPTLPIANTPKQRIVLNLRDSAVRAAQRQLSQLLKALTPFIHVSTHLQTEHIALCRDYLESTDAEKIQSFARYLNDTTCQYACHAIMSGTWKEQSLTHQDILYSHTMGGEWLRHEWLKMKPALDKMIFDLTDFLKQAPAIDETTSCFMLVTAKQAPCITDTNKTWWMLDEGDTFTLNAITQASIHLERVVQEAARPLDWHGAMVVILRLPRRTRVMTVNDMNDTKLVLAPGKRVCIKAKLSYAYGQPKQERPLLFAYVQT